MSAWLLFVFMQHSTVSAGVSFAPKYKLQPVPTIAICHVVGWVAITVYPLLVPGGLAAYDCGASDE